MRAGKAAGSGRHADVALPLPGGCSLLSLAFPESNLSLTVLYLPGETHCARINRPLRKSYLGFPGQGNGWSAGACSVATTNSVPSPSVPWNSRSVVKSRPMLSIMDG